MSFLRLIIVKPIGRWAHTNVKFLYYLFNFHTCSIQVISGYKFIKELPLVLSCPLSCLVTRRSNTELFVRQE